MYKKERWNTDVEYRGEKINTGVGGFYTGVGVKRYRSEGLDTDLGKVGGEVGERRRGEGKGMWSGLELGREF